MIRKQIVRDAKKPRDANCRDAKVPWPTRNDMDYFSSPGNTERTGEISRAQSLQCNDPKSRYVFSFVYL